MSNGYPFKTSRQTAILKAGAEAALTFARVTLQQQPEARSPCPAIFLRLDATATGRDGEWIGNVLAPFSTLSPPRLSNQRAARSRQSMR